MNIRNVAIIAHVDHGKTTLVDALLKQTGTFHAREKTADRVLDSMDLERERGITILAKNTSVFYDDVKINIVDTPGHADFGGEVERIIRMVDGVLLVVDAAEGPLPQTRYVLQKALEQGLQPIVVVNKIDRQDARPYDVLDEVLDLFIELGADDDQVEFPVLWSVARDGIASEDLDEVRRAMETGEFIGIQPLLSTIVQHVPAPNVHVDGAFQMLVTALEYDDYVGRLAVGRIERGTAREGMAVQLCRSDSGKSHNGNVAQLYTYERLERRAVEQIQAGDIVALSGMPSVAIGDTITDPEHAEPMPALQVDEPTLTMIFRVNDGPFAGREGEFVTSRQLRERLFKEAHTNVALQVNDTDSADAFEVRGRGELHLSILIETMRREGYEFTVSKPEPVLKRENDKVLEPLEFATVEVPQEYAGTVIELFGERKAEMTDMVTGDDGTVRLEFIVPARGLVGFQSRFLTETRGYGVMWHTFHGYDEHRGAIPGRTTGSVVAWEEGVATAHAMIGVQERARLFIEPGTEVYEGMVIGENSRPEDLEVNIARKRNVSNVRSAHAEIAEKLDSPVKMSLEQALAYISLDELVEITPKSIRLRKRILDRSERHHAHKKGKKS